MPDKVCGALIVGTNGNGEVVINLDADTVAGFDSTGGHIVFSHKQARSLGRLLFKKAGEAQGEIARKSEASA